MLWWKSKVCLPTITMRTLLSRKVNPHTHTHTTHTHTTHTHTHNTHTHTHTTHTVNADVIIYHRERETSLIHKSDETMTHIVSWSLVSVCGKSCCRNTPEDRESRSSMQCADRCHSESRDSSFLMRFAAEHIPSYPTTTGHHKQHHNMHYVVDRLHSLSWLQIR